MLTSRYTTTTLLCKVFRTHGAETSTEEKLPCLPEATHNKQYVYDLIENALYDRRIAQVRYCSIAQLTTVRE